MISTPREILSYITEDGRCPFEEWLESLKDRTARALIRKKLNRVRLGNLGKVRHLGDGVSELKLDLGPGYRLYFGEDGIQVVVLLLGGDKGSQKRDIEKAKTYWRDYHA